MLDMCHRAMTLLLLRDGSKVLLQPKQWSMPVDEIKQGIVDRKRLFVTGFDWPPSRSAFGDQMGDDGPGTHAPPPRSGYEPVAQFIGALEERDACIAKVLEDEFKQTKDGSAWPSHLHRGRWRALDAMLQAGTLKAWATAHKNKFRLVTSPPGHWGHRRGRWRGSAADGVAIWRGRWRDRVFLVSACRRWWPLSHANGFARHR